MMERFECAFGLFMLILMVIWWAALAKLNVIGLTKVFIGFNKTMVQVIMIVGYSVITKELRYIVLDGSQVNILLVPATITLYNIAWLVL